MTECPFEKQRILTKLMEIIKQKSCNVLRKVFPYSVSQKKQQHKFQESLAFFCFEDLYHYIGNLFDFHKI